MKIDRLQTFIVSVPYLHAEVSSRIRLFEEHGQFLPYREFAPNARA